MKKTTIYIVMALLCLNFKAQAQFNEAVDVTLKGIQIGQKVPDITITGLHNYRDASGKPSTTAKLSDFKGKQLILDFWATWCSPCVAMIPKMDSLQKVFGDKIQFLSVTYQTEKEVLPFLEKFEKQQGNHYDLPVVTSSKQLHQLFPHTTLPHYVWIDAGGVVVAMTGYEEVISANIDKVIDGKSFSNNNKTDVLVSYNSAKPLFINGNGGNGEMLISHSLLAKYVDGLGSGHTVRSAIKKTRQITATNYPVLNLIQLAYGNGKYNWLNNRTEIAISKPENITSKLTGQKLEEWLKDKNAFTYELILPASSERDMYQQMKRDLSYLFSPYDISIENRAKTCLALVEINDKKLFKSDGRAYSYQSSQDHLEIENSFFSVFIYSLETNYLKGMKIPIINDTHFNGKVMLSITGNLQTIDGLNKGLETYGLKLEEKEMSIPVLVIKDRAQKEQGYIAN